MTKKETPDSDRAQFSAGPDDLSEAVPTQTTRIAGRSGRRRKNTLAPGRVVGDYTIREQLGSGGSGTVYMAERRARGDWVAVKVLHPYLATSERQVQRFVLEAQAIQMIRHPALVEIYDRGTLEDGRPYFVMELIQGQSLAQLVAQKGRFSPAESLAVLTPICEALDKAHDRGVVHRDIKASNVMLEGSLDRPRIKLLDFGIAKLMNSEPGDSVKTSIGLMLGSPYSMAPEQILQTAVDARTDIYSLGILAYLLLTGEYPFLGSDPKDIADQHLQAAPPRPSRLAPLSPRIDAVVMRAMEKRPEHRYASVKAFLAAFAHAVESSRPAAETLVQALAIYVDGRMDAEVESDEVVQCDMLCVIEIAAEVLSDSGFQLVLETSHSVLGAAAITGGEGAHDEAALDQARARAVEVAHRLAREIAERPGRDSRLHVNLVLHCTSANARKRAEKAGELEILGGAILDVGTWAPQHDLAGVTATAAVVGHDAAGGQEYVQVYEQPPGRQ
jgi:eukaryotic-like serine/threonine-protein kinase